MRIGWRTYLKHKFQPKSPFFAVGIAVSQDRVTFTALKRHGEQLCVHSEECVSHQQWPAQLGRWVEQLGAAGTPCYAAFSLHDYQLLQTDRPAVPEQELSAALTWTVKELVSSDQPVVLDYFELPVALAGNAKINVVALPRHSVESTVQSIIQAGLDLKNLSVEELATCELTPYHSDPVLTLIQEAGEEIVLNIVRDGQLYVSRRLKGFENLGSFSEEELRMGVVDSLSVQIQRSMDYFESQLRQAPVRQIRIRLDSPHADILAQQINQVVPAQVEELLPDVEVAPPLTLNRLNYTSLGMALSDYRQQQGEAV